MQPIRLIFIIFLTTILAYSMQAQVVINEFSAANYDDAQDNYGEYEDYIELYNSGSSPVDLSGYYLSDKLTNLDKWEIPAGVTIPANGHLLIWCDDRSEVAGGSIHSNFKITQTKQNEAVVFSDPSLQIVDFNEINFPSQKNHSWARTTDGTGTWGIQMNPTPGTTNTNVQDYYSAKPEISPAAGLYTSATQVTLSSTDPNATIHYTLNGDEPTQGDPSYSGPFMVSQTSVVRAKAFNPDPNVPPSFIETNTYFINDVHTIPVISVSGSGLPNLLGGSWGAEPEGHFEYFAADQTLNHEVLGEYNKHGNDSWAYSQRGIDFIARDQFGHDYAVHDQIFPNKTRTEFQRLIIKAAANDNYSFEPGGAHIRDAYVHTLSQRANLKLDERTSQACILYMNGQYWGVYDVREKVDDNDFTQFYYGQGRKWIDYIKTWGNTWEEYGSIQDWDALTAYIDNNDMSVQANYEYVKTQMEVESLVDYIIINTHVVCSDWLNYNTAWWRGRNPDGQAQRWRYTLWDMDASFGHYINYTGVPEVGPTADPCDPESSGVSDPQGHVDMLTSLYANDEFFNLYINRYADLNNTYFTCDYMEGLLDEMINEITPEMPAQIARWGGTMAGWEANVQALRNFIQTRCTVLDQGIVDCYPVTGPFSITVNVEPVGSPNDVIVNTVVPLSYPYVGDYFGDTDMTLTAQAASGWYFNYWTVANHTFGPDQFADAITMAIQTNDNIVAFFTDVPVPPDQGLESYTGCDGDGYSIMVNGTLYDETNPVGQETIVGGAADGQDSIININLVFNAHSTGSETYSGFEGDGYSITVNGTVYNEFNPMGQETLQNSQMCDSIVTVDLFFQSIGCNDPSNLQAVVDYDNATLTWDGPNNASEYAIRFRRSLNPTWTETSQFSPMYNLFNLIPCGTYYFQVKSICADNNDESDYVELIFETGCNTDTDELPATVSELDIYPNPFKSEFNIDLALNDASDVRISIHDVTGKELTTVDKGILPSGNHTILLTEMRDAANGVYLVKMNIGNEYIIRELVKMD